MKRTAAITCLLFLVITCHAQVVFKTIVPEKAVISGESFLVQYVAENIPKVEQFRPVEFKEFRIAHGLEEYRIAGKGTKSTNFTYTLHATAPGRFRIPGAVATINGKNYKSPDAWVTVIGLDDALRDLRQNGYQPDNLPATAYLLPGEDPYQKIKQNLFVKVSVDKRTCFTGEPIVATFKLYSRLQSRSEILKNPGFYGFTVQDMIGLTDNVSIVEKLNGVPFNVHTIRKVQLYPLQAGSFNIDAMEIRNKVDFFRSAVNQRSEQEIVEAPMEGVTTTGDKFTYESTIASEPIAITVKDVPVSNKPEIFNGAVGRFSMEATLEKPALARNEEGYFLLTIKGKGNFSQLSAPVINWPAGIEGFEPTVIDQLDKSTAPLTGSRTFRYAFIAPDSGNFILSPASFSYFDIDSNRFKTITTSSLPVSISRIDKTREVVAAPKESISSVNRRSSLVAAAIVFLVIVSALIFWITRSKEAKPAPTVVFIPPAEKIDALLQPVWELSTDPGNGFYSALHQAIWNYLGTKFSLSGGTINKRLLSTHLEAAGKNQSVIESLMRIIHSCEQGMFTTASLMDDRETLLNDTRVVLLQLDDHSAYL